MSEGIIIDLNELADEIHAEAVEKGFWDLQDAEEKAFACMHAELSEAIQEDRKGMPMLYRPCLCSNEGKMCRMEACEYYCAEHCKLAGLRIKPEGVAVELADFVMRMLDWAKQQGLNLKYRNITVCNFDTTLPNLVNSHHEDISKLWNVYMTNENAARMVSKVVSGCEWWIKKRGYDLFGIIRMKMEYNKTRSRLHGRKY